MIAAAALLVLLGLGLFVGGILTGLTTLYWACVAVCVVAAVLLVLARRQVDAPPRATAATAPAATHPLASATPVTAGGAAVQRAEAADAPATPPGATTPAAPVAPGPPQDLPDPPVEEVEVTDLLLVVDLTDEVLVIDEHPRYHLAGCVHLAGRTTIPLPLDEARADGFTPCAVCAPDRNLAERARARKAAGST
ncbi:hypothetical protein [Blastococcus deserti]|uniref:Uncharacterized protein n=1 Tax=Blastococcus deserti TaxID=2259033 RepID=A0ABW4XCC8_9ACTN